MLKINLLIITATLILIVGCTSKPEKSAQSHEIVSVYNRWVVDELPVANKKLTLAPDAFLAIEESRIYGCAGDNRFFGKFSLEGDKVNFGNVGMTRMLGPNTQFEDAFTSALNKAKFLKIIDGKLRLLDKDNNLLISFKLDNKGK